MKYKVKLKQRLKNMNIPKLGGEQIKPGREYEVDITEAEVKSEYVKHWFTITPVEAPKPKPKAAVEQKKTSLPKRASA